MFLVQLDDFFYVKKNNIRRECKDCTIKKRGVNKVGELRKRKERCDINFFGFAFFGILFKILKVLKQVRRSRRKNGRREFLRRSNYF